MTITLASLADLKARAFDDIIDVRSPSEYAEDHLPGAINLPVLDDEERARIGTIYKQVSTFDARKIGAALVARNSAAHIEGPLADRPGGWRPLVYCWRGGQRSGSFATILAGIGWRVEVLDGGYRSWRRLVAEAVHDRPVASPVIVLGGDTGSAKTELLNMLPERGVQVIDLEGLANHRGSLFGGMGGQPSQKAFESTLAMVLERLDPARPVVVESESARIGDLALPARLWAAMKTAPRILLEAPVAARSEYLIRAYRDIIDDHDRLGRTIDALRPYQPVEIIKEWHRLAGAGAYADLAADLVIRHYDPRYRKHRARMETPVTGIAADDLSPQALPALADHLARIILKAGGDE